MASKTRRPDFLNLGAWQERSAVCGPGERFVLWVQGCRLHCPGCINAEFLPFVPRHRVRVEEMAERILAVRGIEGVTYSGGEPTAQARGLALLSERLRPHGLTVVCYTGHTLESLRRKQVPWVKRLLSQVDILIDGPYVREQAANLLWRGSSNQRVHLLTAAYRHLEGWRRVARRATLDARRTEVEFGIGRKGFTTTGTWPEGFLDRLREVLRR